MSSMRARNRRPSVGISRVGTIVASAHAQDFQRRRRPTYLSSASVGRDMAAGGDDSTDEDDEGDLSTDEDSGSTVNEPEVRENDRPRSIRQDGMNRIAE
jgi:hypothetical protein